MTEPAQANMSGSRPKKMANCPSAVPGANTRLATTADGVEVIVTASDPEAERKIVELAEFHARNTASEPGTRHTGKREGSARIGFCPTVHANATIKATAVPGGIRLEIKATEPEHAKELQDVTKARAARLPGFVSS